MTRRLLLAALAVALAGGCGEAGGTTGAAAAEPAGDWQLVEGTGPDGAIDPGPGRRITLLLDGSELGGSSGCNAYGGEAEISGERFELGPVAGTEMACEPAVMAAERAYLDALARADRIARAGDRLLLTGPAVELAFEPVPPVPVHALVGTRWQLEALLDGETASSVSGEPTLLLHGDGRIEGSTGCRTFAGEYVVRGGEVGAWRLAAAGDPCTAQDEHVLAVLGDGFRAEVDGDRLTVTADGGRGLVYRAAG